MQQFMMVPVYDPPQEIVQDQYVSVGGETMNTPEVAANPELTQGQYGFSAGRQPMLGDFAGAPTMQALHSELSTAKLKMQRLQERMRA
jgi:hypothetical protein